MIRAALVRRAQTGGRPLTGGEVDLARSMFGDALDYAPVRVHRRCWWPLQPRRVVMAPDGAIWFHPESPDYHADFSAAPRAAQGLFIHELVHVWQHQTGLFLPWRRHPFCRYAYRLEPGRPFHHYGIEQQAEIVRHAFLAAGAAPPGRGGEDAVRLAALLPFGARAG